MAMRPPPQQLLDVLVAEGRVTADQALMAADIPVADDIAVEADSGGHTDNRPIHVILPLILSLRDRLQEELQYETPVRVGVGGGIGCPRAVAGAIAMGAAFVVTGTVNQMARQSGSSDRVRAALAKAASTDVTMAPAADMFDQGVKLQVLKRGTMFPGRADKLWALFTTYDSLEAIPRTVLEKLERQVFLKPVAEVWAETCTFYRNRLKDPERIVSAEADPKLKMSLVFRWYLSKSSGWANRGDADRTRDYQIWCGPAIGAFNAFIKDTYLDPAVANAFPCVVQTNLQLLRGACYLRRLEVVRSDPAMARALLKSQKQGGCGTQVVGTYCPTEVLQPRR